MVWSRWLHSTVFFGKYEWRCWSVCNFGNTVASIRTLGCGNENKSPFNSFLFFSGLICLTVGSHARTLLLQWRAVDLLKKTPCYYPVIGFWWEWFSLLSEVASSFHFSQKDCPSVDYRLAGLVVKASASGVEDLGFEYCLWRAFSWSSHTSDLIGTPVATLPGAWHYRVSAGTGQPGVSILWLGEVESLICNFYYSVAACKFVYADPSLMYTSMLLGR